MRRDIFSIDSSKVDLNRGSTANFSRSSSIVLEREVDGSVQLYPVDAFSPAFYAEDGAFLLEPVGINYIIWNMNLSRSEWIKGSNVIVQPDEVKAPDSSYLGDRLIWVPGIGSTQILRYTASIPAGTTFTLWGILKLAAGQFGGLDVLRCVNGVVGSPILNLSLLNQQQGRYRIVELSLTTAGRQPTYPATVKYDDSYVVTAVTPTTVTITIPNAAVAAGDWVGGRVRFSNLPDTTFYPILANTASSGNSVVVTLLATNLPGSSVTTSSRVLLEPAANESVDIEFYVERSIVLEWGGLKLEPLPFRTSMIYQESEIRPRSEAELSWRNSPIAGLKTFFVFLNIKFWRGDGNLLDCGNFRIWIEQSRLFVQAGSTTLSTSDTLPATNVKILVQVSEELATISAFVNQVLKARTSLPNFTADSQTGAMMTSLGVRAIQTVLVNDTLLLDGQPGLGDLAGEEVDELFTSPVVVDATAISAHAPMIQLNPVTIPSKVPPIAQTPISAINTGTRVATVTSTTGFIVSQPVSVVRRLENGEELIVARLTVEAIPSSTTITLDSVSGVLLQDLLTFGNVTFPGRASARFPFDPIDQQTIAAIDTSLRRLSVTSALSFAESRAFIVSQRYEDKLEVIVRSVDPTNNFIFVDNVTGIVVGDVIIQPLNEQLIDPKNYFAGIINPVDGVRIVRKYRNGIVLENNTTRPISVTPFIRVFL